MNTTSTPLPLLWAVIILAAALSGLLVGLLTYVHTKGNWSASLLAALVAAGATMKGAHELLS